MTMSNIFAGLEDLGFKNVEKVDVYQESDSEKKKQEAAKGESVGLLSKKIWWLLEIPFFVGFLLFG